MPNRGDIDLSWEGELHGFMLQDGKPIVEQPMHQPTRAWTAEQKTWIAGRGRASFSQEPAGYFDSQDLWTMTDGALFPSLQWKWMKGIRNADFLAPGSVAWKRCLGTSLYISSAFAASASYNADKARILIRRVGNPGTLTFKLASDSTGSPGSVLQTVTVTTTTVTDKISLWVEFDWSGVQALTSGTTYHVYVYGAATDSEAHHWEVAVDTTGSASKISAAGSTWAAAGYTMYYRVTDADVKRVLHDFVLEGATYVVDNKDAGTASQLWINGDRGTATSGSTTTLVDTGKTWVANRWAGAYVKIISGAGDGQYLLITSNDTTTLNFAATDIAIASTSKYVIYGTDWFTEITGHGLGRVTGEPAIANNIAFFPQNATTTRQMTVNGSSYTYGDGTGGAKAIHSYVSNGAWQLAKVASDNYTLSTATPPTSIGAETWTELGKVGGSDYNVTSMTSSDGILYVSKEDGPYKVSGSIVVKMSTGFDAIPSRNTGAAAAWHNSAFYMSFGGSIIKIFGGQVTDIHNYRSGYDGLPTTRRGNCSAIVPALGWVFFAFDGGDSNWSTLMAYNEIGFCELMRGYKAGARMRNAFWQSCPETHPRLWVNINGELVYLAFPRNGANPLRDTACTFQHEAVCVTPTIDINERSMYKIATVVRAITERLGNGTVGVEYQTDDAIGTEGASAWNKMESFAVSPRDTVNVFAGGIFQIRYRHIIRSTSASSPPIIRALAPEGEIKAQDRWQWSVTLKFGPNVIDKMGARMNPNDELAWLKERASRADKMLLHSATDPALDGRVVIIESPSRLIEHVLNGKWSGSLWLTIREA